MPSPDGRPWLGRVSLRLRLTIWVIAVVVLIQSALAAVAYLYEHQSARGSLDRMLRVRAERLAADIESPPESPPLQLRAAAESQNPLFERFALAVYDASGRLIAESEPDLPEAAQNLAARALDQEGPRFSSWTTPLGERQRAVAVPFPHDRNMALVAWTSDVNIIARVEAIRRALLLAAPFAAAGAAVAGWFIAGVAVGPIQEMRVIARQLTPESVGRGVRLGSAAAEVAQLQNNLNEALVRLDHGYQAQARFVSNVSHEFKTPISTLLAESQAILRHQDKLSPEAASFVRSVEEEMRRLGRLIESFLLLTRVREGGGGAPPPMMHVLANELVVESIAHCASFAKSQGVALHPTLLDDDDGIDLCVHGESELLRTMLDNLVRNAIRFSPRGEAVEVQLVRSAPRGDRRPPSAPGTANGSGNGWISIVVRDHGPGIPEGLIPTIFDRFTQAPEERSNGRGTGLGLEIAKGVAELHGGDIRVTNCPDTGARFEVQLPAAPASPNRN
jgi:two-component system, OmpR family, sensor kinase